MRVEYPGTSIRVKVNIAGLLRAQLARKSWQGEGIAIGAATDPYQPAEGRYRLTRSCLEVLRNASNAFSIITRGPLDRPGRRPARGGVAARARLRHVLPARVAPGLRAALRAWGIPAPNRS